MQRSATTITASWVAKRSESFRYDTLGRLEEIVHPDATSVRYTYDAGGSILTLRDETHSTPNTFYTYDPAGRLAEVRQTVGTGNVITRYAYDGHGNLSAVTDPNGNVTTYLYDDFGALIRQQSPVTGTTTSAYDLAGQLVSTTDATRGVE